MINIIYKFKEKFSNNINKLTLIKAYQNNEKNNKIQYMSRK